MYELVEAITTLSGEAPIIGKPVLLLRFSGCNLNCRYCDTPHKAEKNLTLSQEELLKLIISNTYTYPNLAVLLTGGEPLLAERQRLLLEIMTELPEINFYIETNGSIPIRDFSLRNSHFVVDWKTPSSGAEGSFCHQNLGQLQPARDCIKLVVKQSDYAAVKDIIARIRGENPLLPVYLSPQYDEANLKQLAEFILDNRLPVNLSVQLHKLIWQNRTSGV